MKQKTEELKQICLSRVLELYSEGKTERDIAKVLGVSPATVHRDLVELRQVAIKGIEDDIAEVPFQWQRCITSYDMLIRRSNSLLESDDVDKLSLIKLIAELQKIRLDLYSAPAIMQKAVEHVQKLQNKIAALHKEQHKGAAYDFVYEVDKAAGQEDKVTRKIVRKKNVEEQIIV